MAAGDGTFMGGSKLALMRPQPLPKIGRILYVRPRRLGRKSKHQPQSLLVRLSPSPHEGAYTEIESTIRIIRRAVRTHGLTSIDL